MFDFCHIIFSPIFIKWEKERKFSKKRSFSDLLMAFVHKSIAIVDVEIT